METQIPEIQVWLQLATSTGFVGLSWYLIVYALPQMQERFDNHARSQIQEFRDQLKYIVDRHEKAIEVMTQAHERQIEIIMKLKDKP
jgi:hypothetical protein